MKIFFQNPDFNFVCFEILDIVMQRKMQKERKGNETAANIQIFLKAEWTISSLKPTAALILLWVEIFLTDLQPLECDKLSRTLE